MPTLLIVDSSEQICREIMEFSAHYSDLSLLPCAHNGKDALTYIQENEVDILLMDVVLPLLDGLGVLNALRSMELKRQPAVFIYTAFLDNRLLQELQKLGVAYCFVKPMDPEHIIPRIFQLLPANDAAVYPDTSLPSSIPAPHNAQEELGNEITRQIRAIGVPAHLRGYHYLRAGIQFSIEAQDPASVAVTKDIYPYIAKLYHTRPALVERSIRNAIEVAWTRGNTQILHKYFGYTIDDFKGKPTNAEFIAMIADRIRMKQ